MKGSDYIVDFLIRAGVRHAFGYPGGMVTHLMDSLDKRSSELESHVMRHEQGGAFAACGYAQATGGLGVAYATSGPGATNLVTGICDAWFDSLPVMFITGQVNSFELKGSLPVRQRGFQETDIVAMSESVTKYAVQVTRPEDLPECLAEAREAALTGRRGPVLVDVCMDVMRSDVATGRTSVGEVSPAGASGPSDDQAKVLDEVVSRCRRPVLLLGNGARMVNPDLLSGIGQAGIPVVTSMPAFDLGAYADLNLGFVGAYGSRAANFAVAKSDLVIAVGSRMDVRQVGARRDRFAPGARIARIDIDPGELSYALHDDDILVRADAAKALRLLLALLDGQGGRFAEWRATCRCLRDELKGMDSALPNELIAAFDGAIGDGWAVTADVGQNQVWVAQSLPVRPGRKVLFSAGHGAMGYSLPAAIGACVGLGSPVACFAGDGGLQMNIQELQVIAREGLPVKIILLNNGALGMIRHFQEMYFDGRYVQTTPDGGYDAPDFEMLARAYGIPYALVRDVGDVDGDLLSREGPQLVEARIPGDTYVFPKLEYGKPNQDQEPLLDRKLYDRLMSL